MISIKSVNKSERDDNTIRLVYAIMNDIIKESNKTQSSDKKDTDTFCEIFSTQAENQRMMFRKGMYDGFTNIDDNLKYNVELPIDDPKLCSYHIQQLISEVGELLDADKRWKNFRNDKCDKRNKLEELADCFIVLMNIAMFSGYESYELFNEIKNKLNLVRERIEKN